MDTGAQKQLCEAGEKRKQVIQKSWTNSDYDIGQPFYTEETAAFYLLTLEAGARYNDDGNMEECKKHWTGTGGGI